jgi:hypothetical protein
MITITKGNPTAEEIAGLLVALTLARGEPQRGIGATGAPRRRPTPFAEFGATSHGRERRWREWSSGWSPISRPHGAGLSPQLGVHRKRAS